MNQSSTNRPSAWRSRWAAVGAAVAVTLGAGGLVAVDAASSEPSSFVAIEPTRILDTRTDVGLPGPPASGTSAKLQVTGVVPTQPPGDVLQVNVEVVPSSATSVVFNVTVLRPTTRGFLSVRPGDAQGTPATSNINWAAGSPNIANAVTVQLPASGAVDIFVNGTVDEVLIDVAGYNKPATAGPPGPVGPEGPKGDPGDIGPAGPSGITPAPGKFTPTQIIKGAILTCSQVTVGGTSCTGVAVNGIPLMYVAEPNPAANQICQAVVGSDYYSVDGYPVRDDPPDAYVWDGSAWAFATEDPSLGRVAQIWCSAP